LLLLLLLLFDDAGGLQCLTSAVGLYAPRLCPCPWEGKVCVGGVPWCRLWNKRPQLQCSLRCSLFTIRQLADLAFRDTPLPATRSLVSLAVLTLRDCTSSW